MCSPGKRVANAFSWLCAGSILASFNIHKPIGEDGRVIEPEVTYRGAMIRSVSLKMLLLAFNSWPFVFIL